MTVRRLRWVLLFLAVALIALIALAVVRAFQAAHAGRDGEQQLTAAVALMTPNGGFETLTATTLDEARTHLEAATHDFAAMRDDLDGAGPMFSVARVLPFLRVQARGVVELANAGGELAVAGERLADTARSFIAPSGATTTLSSGDVLGQLRILQGATQTAVSALSDAINHLATLNGYRLVGPLSDARAQLVAKLPPLETRAAAARDGLNAFINFAGATGPRRYLVLSQNPDEVRPTGGFMGSYGLISANDGRFHVLKYGDTNTWDDSHPQAVIAERHAAPAIFHIANSNEDLANTNATPDWSTDARLAARLWQMGGEKPVDGVLSFTPQFLARLVTILGPIPVPAYGDTVTGKNLAYLTDYWTHHAPSQPVPGGRKEFLTVLAPLVLHRIVTAPATEWPRLAAAVADGFADQEAMLWSSDSQVQQVIDAHRWSYSLIRTIGDFYADSEFEFAAKNGSGIHRVFDHTVVIHPDGGATVTTVMTLHNTEPYTSYNDGSGGYFTPYGPADATLASTSDPPLSTNEPDVDGHPAAGWVLRPPPQGVARLKVVWNVPYILEPRGNNEFAYVLTWMPTPSHSGDVVHLHVELPAGWQWVGPAPPSTLRTNSVTGGNWLIKKP